MKRTPLKRTGIRRKPRRNNMSRESHDAVIRRDGQCVAQVLDPSAGLCRDPFGRVQVSWDTAHLTVDHLKDGPMMGQSEDRDDPNRAVTLCYGHHIAGGWATSHRPLLRVYLLFRVGHGMPTLVAAAEARKDQPDA